MAAKRRKVVGKKKRPYPVWLHNKRSASKTRKSNPGAKRARRSVVISHGGGVFKKLMSMDGVVGLGLALAAPLAASYVAGLVSPKVITADPKAIQWTNLLVKAGVVAGGTFLLAKYLKNDVATYGWALTGSASIAAEVLQPYMPTIALHDAQLAYAAQPALSTGPVEAYPYPPTMQDLVLMDDVDDAAFGNAW